MGMYPVYLATPPCAACSLHAGYYRDMGLEGWARAKSELAKAKPTAIKANKSMVKLPNRGGGSGGGGGPLAKKAKTGALEHDGLHAALPCPRFTMNAQRMHENAWNQV